MAKTAKKCIVFLPGDLVFIHEDFYKGDIPLRLSPINSLTTPMTGWVRTREIHIVLARTDSHIFIFGHHGYGWLLNEFVLKASDMTKTSP